ncbi:MAG: chemotaxis protein CheW, partial [Anaerolineales bacterium]
DVELLPLLKELDENAVQSDSGDQPAVDQALSLDQIIIAIDEEVEAGLEPLRDVQVQPIADAVSEEAQFISFSLAGTEYAIPIQNVTEIAYIPEVTPLPNVPPWILGVANLRGDLLSIVDLRAFFGLERTTLTGMTRMLVARTSGEDMTVGLLVDQAQGLRNLRLSEIETPTGDIESQIAPYLYGAYDGEDEMLVLLDLDQVLMSPRLRQFEPQAV